MSLPVINISPLVTGASSEQFVAGEIRKASVETGFFYITGHGIDEGLQKELEEACQLFFEQETPLKMRIRMALGGKAWRGYFPVGNELTAGKPDLKEGLYFGSELPASDERVLAGLPMHGPNLFPEEIPGLRKAVLEYMDAMTTLRHALMRGISLSLGLDRLYFNTHYTYDPLTLFRVFHYPPVSQDNAAAQWGVGEHTDYGVLTILKQDDSGGLQVKSKSGWIDAPPVSGSFICNIGDMLDRITRGFYRSTPHRVLNRSAHGRYSFPFFFDPDFGASIEPVEIPDQVDYFDDHAERWDKSSVHAFEGTYGDYLLGKVGKVFPDL